MKQTEDLSDSFVCWSVITVYFIPQFEICNGMFRCRWAGMKLCFCHSSVKNMSRHIPRARTSGFNRFITSERSESSEADYQTPLRG